MNERYLFRGKPKSFEYAEIRCVGNPAPEWAVGSLHRNPSGEYVVTHYKNSRTYSVDPATIGQCTGLRAAKSYRGDKPEDLLIFEGDIVRTTIEHNPYLGGDKTIVTHVNWDDGCWWVGDDEVHLAYQVRNDDEIEIIGNRWDTPELLEV
jgi:uncharacterized phage protein (TIGR01671 family)